MKVKFWGVRGAVPTWRPDAGEYGGNTSCLQVLCDEGEEILLDAGTGILNMIKHLRQTKSIDRKDPVHLFLSHTHYDHVLGLPFYLALYRKVPVHIYLYNENRSAKDVISSLMSRDFCPIGLDSMPLVSLHNLSEGQTVLLPQFKVHCRRTIHSSNCMGFGIEADGRKCVYITDHELPPAEEGEFAKYVDFCRGADVLIHDAQYTPRELTLRRGWGHSSYDRTVQLAVASEVSRLVLFHHDPGHSDEALQSILNKSKGLIDETGSLVKCYLAREFWEIEA